MLSMFTFRWRAGIKKKKKEDSFTRESSEDFYPSFALKPLQTMDLFIFTFCAGLSPLFSDQGQDGEFNEKIQKIKEKERGYCIEMIEDHSA